MPTPEAIPTNPQERIPLLVRNKMQVELIKEFCEIMTMQNPSDQHTCVLGWIEKYADNLDQLGKPLIECYCQADNEKNRKEILQEIQAMLDQLNKLNG